MSVLYVLKRYPRLSETFVVREIIGLERGGLRIGIDALLPPEPGARHRDVDDVRARVRYLPRHPRLWHAPVLAAHLRLVVRHPLRWVGQALAARRAGTWRRFLQAALVAERARRGGYRSLHAHFATASTEVARHAAALAGLPFTVTAHAKDIYAQENAALVERRLHDAHAVVTVSAYNGDHLRRVVPSVPVTVIRNGVPAARPTPRQPAGPVLCVARMVEKKGLDVLLDAVAAVIRTRPQVRLEVIGDGPLLAALREQTDRLGIAAAVDFRGALPAAQVHAAYRRCSLVALACRIAADGDRDGLPTVLVEAMSHGLPVVATDVVGIAELVQHRRTGLLVPAEHPQALAAAIDELLGDAQLADTLGRAGRRLVLEAFDPAASTEQLAGLFAQVAR